MKKLLLLLLIPKLLWAASALPLTFNQIIDQSGKIFVGRCLKVENELDERGIPSLWLRYQVTEAVLGVEGGGSVLIKQYGVGSCDPAEELLLFFYPDSDYGFTSTIGLGQGRFVIKTDSFGVRYATEPFPHLADEVDEVSLEDLLERIRKRLKR